MNTKFKIDDVVRVLRHGTAGKHMQGAEGRVVKVEDGWVYVEDRTGGGLFSYGGTKSWMFTEENVELVETKAVKTRSQEIEKHEIQKGDLLVCFWQLGGVELRRKGVAHESDYDDDWMTSDGGYLTYDDEYDSAEHIYLLERPEVKEPKGFDALDKTVKYFLKSEGGYSDYVLAYEGGRWTYGWVGDNTRVGAARYEIAFTEGNSDWAKPVPYEPTDLEKHIEAGTIGNRYRSGVVEYKVTKKGKVKGIVTQNPLDTWANVHWSYETFKDYVDRGTIYKI